MTPISPVLTPQYVDKEVVYAKDQPEYRPLPVLRNSQGALLSRWRLSAEERAAIAAGADLFMMNHTFNQPLQPVSIGVDGCDGWTNDIMRQQVEFEEIMESRKRDAEFVRFENVKRAIREAGKS